MGAKGLARSVRTGSRPAGMACRPAVRARARRGWPADLPSAFGPPCPGYAPAVLKAVRVRCVHPDNFTRDSTLHCRGPVARSRLCFPRRVLRLLLGGDQPPAIRLLPSGRSASACASASLRLPALFRSAHPSFTSRSSPRPISTAWLHALLRFHPRPIYLVVCKGSYQLLAVGIFVLRTASRLDAFSVYPLRT